MHLYRVEVCHRKLINIWKYIISVNVLPTLYAPRCTESPVVRDFLVIISIHTQRWTIVEFPPPPFPDIWSPEIAKQSGFSYYVMYLQRLEFHGASPSSHSLYVNVATSAPRYFYLSKIIYKQKPHLLNACPAILISFTLLSSVGTDVCTLQKRRSPVRFCWWAPGRIYNP